MDDANAVKLLRRSTGLDAGESEAIILSDVEKATYLLMDEVKGRLVAKQMGIKVMGTVGLLMVAYSEGLLDKSEIMECIDILKNTGRHISNHLYKQLVDMINQE